MRGLPALEILIDKNSKIIFTSADRTVIEQAFSLGVKDFIKKPFLFKKLIESIHKALNFKSQPIM